MRGICFSLVTPPTTKFESAPSLARLRREGWALTIKRHKLSSLSLFSIFSSLRPLCSSLCDLCVIVPLRFAGNAILPNGVFSVGTLAFLFSVNSALSVSSV